MRARLTVFVLALAVLFRAPAWAQTATPDAGASDFQTRLQASLAWATQFRGIVADLVAPLQRLPDPPELTMSDAQRHTWADASRTWAANTRASVQALRARLAQLPPPPAVSSPTLQAGKARARDQLPEVLSSTLALADAQEQIAAIYSQQP